MDDLNRLIASMGLAEMLGRDFQLNFGIGFFDRFQSQFEACVSLRIQFIDRFKEDLIALLLVSATADFDQPQFRWNSQAQSNIAGRSGA